MNDFIAYVEILKLNFNEFTSIEQKNCLFNRLRKKIRKKFNVVINMLMTRDAFATLTQRIKSLQLFKYDQKNKIHNDRNFLNESDFNLRKRFDNRAENTKKRIKQQDQFIIKIVAVILLVCFNKSRIKRIMLRKTTEIVITVIKKHFIKNCLEFKQKNSQINVVNSFRQNIYENEQKTFFSRFIIEVSNDSKK